MDSRDNMKEYFAKVQSLTNDKIEDLTIVKRVLRTLPLRVDHIVFDIEESTDLSSIKIDELQLSSEALEQRLREILRKLLEVNLEKSKLFSNQVANLTTAVDFCFKKIIP